MLVGVLVGVWVWLGVAEGVAERLAVVDGVPEGERLAVLVRDTVGEAVELGVGVALMQMKGLSAPVVELAAPQGQAVQLSWLGPAHVPAPHCVQLAGPPVQAPQAPVAALRASARRGPLKPAMQAAA